MNRFHRLETRHWILLAVALGAAGLFSGLGLWQADRHGQRQARNDTLRSRLSAPALDAASTTLASDSLAWRRVRVGGRYDYGREIVLRGRAHGGTPGVYVVTPLRRDGAPALLVVRGWIPAADGVHAPLSRGRPSSGPDSAVSVTGVLLPSVTEQEAGVTRDSVDGEPHLVASHVDVAALADSLPYPVAPLYVQRTAEEGRGERRRAGGEEDRLPEVLAAPSPDPGPHFWYAVQWFGFAVIALGGTAAYLWSDLREEPDLGPEGRAVDPGRVGREPGG
ncbi:MAG: SURF1 family protein [Candidatus Palauibacterales bacterium]|nr:SURF1 family protein [Candidatus Palauibacterales bacterium]